MNKKHIFALLLPLLVILVMYPIFQLLNTFFSNWRVAWFIGLSIYWLIFGLICSLFLIGRKKIIELIKPKKIKLKMVLIILSPLLIVIINSLFSIWNYEIPNFFVFSLLLLSAFGNAFFEEILWRGVYFELFPKNILLGIVWPSIGFGLWHYAPGSLSQSNPLILMAGAVVLGLYLNFITRETKTIFWPIIVHLLFGTLIFLF